MSSDNKINLVQLLSACVGLAKLAAAEIRTVAESGDLGANKKDAQGEKQGTVSKAEVESGTDAVTKADLLAQQIIEGSLRHHFPGLRVVGEEDIEEKDFMVRSVDKHMLDTVAPHAGFNAECPLEDVTVYVDPLDATMEFVIGNKFCTIALIGIAVKNEAVGGVMCQPFEGGPQGRTIWAMLGFGAGDDCADAAKNVLTTPRPPARKEVNVVTTRLHNSPAVEHALAAIKPGVDNIIRVGGAGYKVLALLEGTADIYLYPTPGTKKWDTCAPEAILRYFGGRATDCKGNELGYNHELPRMNPSVLATRDATIHEKYVNLLLGK